MIALRRQGDADLADLAEFAGAVGQLSLELIGADFLVEELVGAFDRIQKRRGGGIFRKIKINALVAEPLRLLGEADSDDGRARIREVVADAVPRNYRIDKYNTQPSVVARELVEIIERALDDRLS